MQMLRLRVVSSFLRTEREREREKRNLHHERPLIFGSRGRRVVRSNFSRNYENESYLQIGEDYFLLLLIILLRDGRGVWIIL